VKGSWDPVLLRTDYSSMTIDIAVVVVDGDDNRWKKEESRDVEYL
jgi:hypothetical protein